MKLDNLSLLYAVFESTADGILIVDDAGKIIKFNSQFQKMWRIPESILSSKDDERVLGYILDQLSHPEAFLQKVTELYRDPEAISHDHITFKDGRFFARFSRPLKVQDTTAGRVWSFQDITAYTKNLELFSAITQLCPDIISIINEKGELVYNSEAAARIHGYAADELIGRNTFELIHEGDRERVQRAMAAIFSAPGNSETVQYRYRNKDGTFSWMEATASNQLENPFIRGMVAISREINSRKKLEEELTRALQVRDEFISIVSHELKTPITGMKLQLQLVQRARDRNTEFKPGPQVFEGLLHQTKTLECLIDDLLSISRIRMGTFNINPVSELLSAIISDSCQSFHELLREAGCSETISIEPNVFVYCDRLRIEQVVSNLLSNVIKHAPNCAVHVSLTKTPFEAILSVRDEGGGIPLEKQDLIFNLFERATSSYVAGIGVGLYLSRNITEQHRGTLTVESDGLKGATFVMRLPLSGRGLA